jgi:hypothetical protein
MGEQLFQAQSLHDRQKELNAAHISTKDDIRGNPNNNDAYFTINLKLGVVF